MSKHTPGPWHIGMRNGFNSNMVFARDGKTEHDDSSICMVYGLYMNAEISDQKDAEGIANARLIAAAPELLEALQSALPLLEEFGTISEFEKARAAIAKAKE